MGCITLDAPAYPARLRQIYDPPLVLYVRGNVTALSQPGIAVIGTRHPTPYGIGMAERLASELAGRGYVITEDVKSIGLDVLRHRVTVTYEAEAEDVTAESLVQRIFDHLKVP